MTKCLAHRDYVHISKSFSVGLGSRTEGSMGAWQVYHCNGKEMSLQNLLCMRYFVT